MKDTHFFLPMEKRDRFGRGVRQRCGRQGGAPAGRARRARDTTSTASQELFAAPGLFHRTPTTRPSSEALRKWRRRSGKVRIPFAALPVQLMTTNQVGKLRGENSPMASATDSRPTTLRRLRHDVVGSMGAGAGAYGTWYRVDPEERSDHGVMISCCQTTPISANKFTTSIYQAL
jgi:hypothetical protein